MQESIINIVQDYLELRKTNILKDDGFLLRLKNIGLTNEKAIEILLKMDDEWTLEQIVILKIKEAKQKYLIGISITLLLLIFSILSFFGFLFEGKIQLIAFSLGTLTSGLYGKSKLRSIETIEKNRKLIWQSWLGKKTKKPLKIKRITNSLKSNKNKE